MTNRVHFRYYFSIIIHYLATLHRLPKPIHHLSTKNSLHFPQYPDIDKPPSRKRGILVSAFHFFFLFCHPYTTRVKKTHRRSFPVPKHHSTINSSDDTATLIIQLVRQLSSRKRKNQSIKLTPTLSLLPLPEFFPLSLLISTNFALLLQIIQEPF